MKTNKTMRSAWIGAASLLLLAGCGERHAVVLGELGDGITVRRDTVHLRAADQPRATLEADGTFRVGGDVMEASPVQRERLAAFHAAVMDFTEQSIDVGKDTGRAAAAAARDAVKSRMTGNNDASMSDQIARDVKASVSGSVSVLCDQFLVVYTHQQAVVETRFRPFEPYALMTPDVARRCHEKLPRE